MEHSEAIQMQAAEKYLLGELTEEERHDYEKHFFDCAECAEDVKLTATFIGNARAVFAERAPRRPGTASTAVSMRSPMLLIWPMPIGAAAALVLLFGATVYQSFVLVPRLRNEAQAPQPATWHFLSISRSEPQVVTLPKGHRIIGLTLSRSSDGTFPYYRCEVRDSTGRTVLSVDVPAPPGGEELQLVLPAARLQPGSYAIVLAGLQALGGPAEEADVARYQFTLNHEKEETAKQ